MAQIYLFHSGLLFNYCVRGSYTLQPSFKAIVWGLYFFLKRHCICSSTKAGELASPQKNTISITSQLPSHWQVSFFFMISIGETSLCFNMQFICCLNAASVPNLNDMSNSRVVLAQGMVGGSKYSTVQASKQANSLM